MGAVTRQACWQHSARWAVRERCETAYALTGASSRAWGTKRGHVGERRALRKLRGLVPPARAERAQSATKRSRTPPPPTRGRLHTCTHTRPTRAAPLTRVPPAHWLARAAEEAEEVGTAGTGVPEATAGGMGVGAAAWVRGARAWGAEARAWGAAARGAAWATEARAWARGETEARGVPAGEAAGRTGSHQRSQPVAGVHSARSGVGSAACEHAPLSHSLTQAPPLLTFLGTADPAGPFHSTLMPKAYRQLKASTCTQCGGQEECAGDACTACSARPCSARPSAHRAAPPTLMACRPLDTAIVFLTPVSPLAIRTAGSRGHTLC